MTHATDPGVGSTPTAGITILLIDDDVELCEMMQEFFETKGMRVDAVHDGRRGLARALKGGFDLLLLDVMIPGLDGFELLHQVRRCSTVPVIMLTARVEQADRVMGLDAGADDYLAKPFGPEELVARIRAVLRRTGGPRTDRPEALEVNGVKLDPGTREVWCAGARVDLTSIEYEIHQFHVRAAGRITSRNELMTVLYQREASPHNRSLDVHISHLRKKLGRQGGLIRTIRGVGYLFCADSGGEGEA